MTLRAKDTVMDNETSSDSGELPVQTGRKAWTAPVVSFLSIDDTANQTFSGNDGTGTGTGS